MTNADVTRDLIELTEALTSGTVPPVRVPGEFERLTYLLLPLDREAERQLRAFVNELETILFTKLPANQVPEMVRVLTNAEPIFSASP
ncbi:hypothetical protein OG558_39770 [Kribbella sp. NBC_01510]|uniref:hypothetical protein n=1 Tax=Kribbella sp. NBC_01510 TaxID=2903581 RepID=UPI00386552CF